MHARHLVQPRQPTHARQPRIARHRNVNRLPATAMLPAVAIEPPTAMLPAVAIEPHTAMLRAVAIEPAASMPSESGTDSTETGEPGADSRVSMVIGPACHRHGHRVAAGGLRAHGDLP